MVRIFLYFSAILFTFSACSTPSESTRKIAATDHLGAQEIAVALREGSTVVCTKAPVTLTLIPTGKSTPHGYFRGSNKPGTRAIVTDSEAIQKIRFDAVVGNTKKPEQAVAYFFAEADGANQFEFYSIENEADYPGIYNMLDFISESGGAGNYRGLSCVKDEN